MRNRFIAGIMAFSLIISSSNIPAFAKAEEHADENVVYEYTDTDSVAAPEDEMIVTEDNDSIIPDTTSYEEESEESLSAEEMASDDLKEPDNNIEEYPPAEEPEAEADQPNTTLVYNKDASGEDALPASAFTTADEGFNQGSSLVLKGYSEEEALSVLQELPQEMVYTNPSLFRMSVLDEDGIEESPLNGFAGMNFDDMQILEGASLYATSGEGWQKIPFEMYVDEETTKQYAGFECVVPSDILFVHETEKTEEKPSEPEEETSSESTPTEETASEGDIKVEDTEDIENQKEEVPEEEVSEEKTVEETSVEENQDETDDALDQMVEKPSEESNAETEKEGAAPANESSTQADKKEESQKKSRKSVLKQEKWADGKFTYKDDEVTITAVLTEDNGIPEGAEFVGSRIAKADPKYREIKNQIADLYSLDGSEFEILPYDVHFEKDGEEIEPKEGSVDVSFSLKKSVSLEDNETASVVHVKDSGESEIVAETEAASIKKFEFSVEEFSAIVMAKGPLKAAAIQGENGTYYISKTPNIDNNGVKKSNYSHNMNLNDVVNIPGALKLDISIEYGGESTSYDWACMWVGSYPSYTAYNNHSTSLTGKLGGTHGKKTYEVQGDTVTFGYRTDGSGVGDGYGYYAVITPEFGEYKDVSYHFEELDDGTCALVIDKGGDIGAFVNHPDLQEAMAPYKDRISEVRLHKGTTSVGDGAFSSLPSLKKVTFPRNSQLTTIGRSAFSSCTGLEEITIPPSVTSIDPSAFAGCTGLEVLEFAPGSEMTELLAGMCKNLTGLERVVLPDNITKVPKDMFYGCSKLSEVEMPETVTELGENSFRGTNMKEVPNIENLTTIGKYAFVACKGLTKVSIPATLKTMGGGAFEQCSNITDFIFEDGTSFPTLGGWFFTGMTKLVNVKLPSDLTKIGSHMFNACANLQYVDIPDTVTRIDEYAFAGCTKLQDFEIPSQITTIGPYAFQNCKALKDMTIPSTITSIGNNVFEGCSNLIRCVFEDGAKVSSLPSSMFSGCSKLETVKLPDNVTSIPSSYFYNCTSLQHVDLPAKLTTIGASAFYGCTNLQTMELPSSLKTIDKQAFYNCKSFTNVVIPKSVTSIGNEVWRGCSALRSAEFETGSPLTSLGTYTFYDCTSLTNLDLPDKLTAIPNYMCKGCTSLQTVDIPDKVKTIGQQAFDGCTKFKSVELPAGLTGIYTAAFKNTALTHVDFPNTLGSIGQEAFYGTKLTEVTIPNQVTSIGNSSFANCSSLEEVTLQDGGKNCTIGSSTFSGCTALKDVHLKEGLTSIGSNAFYNNYRLDEVAVPSTVTTIGSSAFRNDRNLKKLEFLSSASNASLTIDSNNSGYTFAGLTNVEEIVIDRNITSSYKNTTNFNDINPEVKFTIGKHVDTLDNIFVSNFTDKTDIVFEGKNDFSVSTRIANKTEDVKWAELKGDFYVDDNGVVYKLNKSKGTASVFHIPAGLTEYTVPATVTSVAGKTYNVTMVNSYAVREADDLTALTFENPEAVTIPQFAFTDCSTLQTINGKTELFKEEWTEVSTLCDFPVHTDKPSTQVTILRDSIPVSDGEKPFSIGVSITGQESMAEDGITYQYPTGKSARLDFAISNESNLDMSDRVIRVYFAFDGDNYTLGNYNPDQDYTLVNTATGSRYPFKVRSTDAKGVYYYDITGFKPGDTLAFNNNFAYLSPKSGGGTMRVWLESISAQQAQEMAGKVSEPGDYILADWYTIPVPYNIKKQVNGSPTYEFIANSSNENDDNIYVRNMSYRIDMTSSGSSGTSYAKDFVTYVDFTDDMILPEGMIWNPELVESVKNGNYYVNDSNYIYAKSGNSWVELGHLTFPNNTYRRGLDLKVVEDQNGNEAIRINWSYKNSYWSDPKTSPTADMPACTYYLYLSNRAVMVKRDSNLWNMLREGEEYTTAESEAMRKVNNTVHETTHYSFSEDKSGQASASDRLVMMTSGFQMTKTMSGSNTFSQSHQYNIALINNGLTHKKDIDIVEDSLRDHYYIPAASIESMLKNAKWGPYVQVDITSATICELPDKEVIDIYGSAIPSQTAQESGADPIPYRGRATTDNSVITTSAKFSIHWNEDRSMIILDKMDSDGTITDTYAIGREGDYPTLQSAFDVIGYVITRKAAYKVTWDLGDSYTLYNAKKNGVEAETVADLTDEQVSEYEYKLKSGRTDTFNIPSKVKDTTMWLETDTSGRYSSNGISSSNIAYAKEDTGRQVGSATWNGTVYSELQLSKSASANGRTWSSGINVPDNTVLDYNLSFSNSGDPFSVLPLTDHMSGAQVLLVPVRGNKDALYFASGETEGTPLSEAGLNTYVDSGITYYVLEQPGTYKGVTIDGRETNSISVTKSQGAASTLIEWYYQNVKNGSQAVSYKALVDAARLGASTTDATGSSITSNAINNESWLGGHQTHRLYASVGGASEQIQFAKHIVENPDNPREKLIGHSLVKDGDEVLYKIVLENTGDSNVTMKGSRIYDKLPSTTGTYVWSKDNVTDIYYVAEDLGSSVETIDPSYWYIDSIQPGSGTNTASTGQYYIKWNNDFELHFGPRGKIWIYVKLKFPAGGDINPQTGEATHEWDNFITKNNGNVLTNSFYVGTRYSSVTHELVDVVEGMLQKGVLDTGLSRAGYFQSEDTRHFYQNGGNTDNGSVQEVAYYTTIYNSGNVRLYLDNLYDQLPKGFKFRGLINYIPTAASTGAGFSTASGGSSNNATYNSLGGYGSITGLANTEYRMVNYASSSIPVATVTDANRNKIVYANASVSAQVYEGDQDQVIFTIKNGNSSSGYTNVSYDSTLGKYYINPGQAVRFGYVCTVQGIKRTDNLANNEIAMPMYDKYGLGVRMSDEEDVSIISPSLRDVAKNDGACTETSTEEETQIREHTPSSWVRNTTQWFSSNVSLQRLEAVPGFLKFVGGESYVPPTATIGPDSIYGSKYTDGSRGGSPYVGTVARTSIVNWDLRAYNEGGTGSNSMEDYWIVDTVDAPYRFTGNFFYDYYSVGGTRMSSSSVPVFSLGGRSENDTTVKISTGKDGNTLTLNGTITVNGAPVSVDDGRAEVQLLRDNEGVETIRIHLKDNVHRIPPNTYMSMMAHTQYVSSDAVLSKQFYNHAQLEPTTNFDPALVSQGKVLYKENEGELDPYAIESGASVTMTAGYSSAARQQITQMNNSSNKGWSDQTENSIELPEKYSEFYYDLFVDLPKDDPTSKLVLINTLPEPGDHSTFVDRDMRGSEFIVHMLSENLGFTVWSTPNAGSGTKKQLDPSQYKLEVSTRTEFLPMDWEGEGEDWHSIDLSDGLSEAELTLLENARSFRVIIDDPNTTTDPENALMGKNSQVQIRFNAELQSPENADPGAIAWNSFGYRYTVPIGLTGMSTSLNAEPLKVGVQVPAVPKIRKDLKTPLDHYKQAYADMTYRFLVYTGSAISSLNDVSEMTEAEIAQILTSNSRDFMVAQVNVNQGETGGETDYLDEEKKWTIGAGGFEPTETRWVWNNNAKYSIIELPWDENGYVFSTTQRSPTNNYTFTQNSEQCVLLRTINVYDRKGNLKVQKTVNGPSFDPERKFTFTIKLKDGRYPAYGTYNYTGTNIANGSLTFNDEGSANIQLKHNQAIELIGIPDEYTYEVSEAEDVWYTQDKTKVEGSIKTNTTELAAFTNTRKDTTLTVTKTVTGNMGDRYKMFRFEVYVVDEGRELSGEYPFTVRHNDGTSEQSTLNFVEGAAFIELRHGDAGIVSNLPVGARYEVDETAASRKGYKTTYDSDSGVLTEAGASSAWTNARGVAVPTTAESNRSGAVLLILSLIVLWYYRKKRDRLEQTKM